MSSPYFQIGHTKLCSLVRKEQAPNRCWQILPITSSEFWGQYSRIPESWLILQLLHSQCLHRNVLPNLLSPLLSTPHVSSLSETALSIPAALHSARHGLLWTEDGVLSVFHTWGIVSLTPGCLSITQGSLLQYIFLTFRTNDLWAALFSRRNYNIINSGDRKLPNSTELHEFKPPVPLI